RVEEFKVKLKEAQSLVEKDPYNKEVKVKAVEALFEYNEAIKMRKTYWLKRPGWNGYEKEEVPLQFVKHFQQFLGNPSSVVDLALSDDLFSIVLTNADAEEMIKKVSEKEIMEAMFDIVDNKAPGPDGFSFVFGFHSKMVGWIMQCVKTAGFTTCFNGERHGFFKGRRGLRQGDPISPYLFTLVMEMLTLLLKERSGIVMDSDIIMDARS
ncbi:RNA-directed DNA polymerase, eukaryota, reverse transcriptase zinc-binding domain protein, partial [Tanacetum coccineum]